MSMFLYNNFSCRIKEPEVVETSDSHKESDDKKKKKHHFDKKKNKKEKDSKNNIGRK